MITQKLNDEKYLQELRKNFGASQPFKYVVIDNFLQETFAKKLSDLFPSIENMATQYKGINEKKAEHSELESLSPEFSQLKKFLFESHR